MKKILLSFVSVLILSMSLTSCYVEAGHPHHHHWHHHHRDEVIIR